MVKEKVNLNVCLDLKNFCLSDVGFTTTVDNVEYEMVGKGCMTVAKTDGQINAGGFCSASEDCVSGNGCLKV